MKKLAIFLALMIPCAYGQTLINSFQVPVTGVYDTQPVPGGQTIITFAAQGTSNGAVWTVQDQVSTDGVTWTSCGSALAVGPGVATYAPCTFGANTLVRFAVTAYGAGSLGVSFYAGNYTGPASGGGGGNVTNGTINFALAFPRTSSVTLGSGNNSEQPFYQLIMGSVGNTVRHCFATDRVFNAAIGMSSDGTGNCAYANFISGFLWDNATETAIGPFKLATLTPGTSPLCYLAGGVNNVGCAASGATLPSSGIVYATSPTTGVAATGAQVLGSFSTNVVYASKVVGVTAGVAVIPGSSSTGDADSWAALNAITSVGNVDLEVDSGFALSAALNIGSNTTIHCATLRFGFIMLPASNAPVLQNAHLNAPTTASGTGGYLVSNIIDNNIRVSGCGLNPNSSQSTTGSNSQGTAHGATPSGLFTYGVNFVGVNGLVFDHNDLYDSGAFNFFASNTQNVWVTENYFHEVVPMIFRYGDGVHFIGPDTNLHVDSNTINASDDAIAFNADDGNRPGSGDGNGSYIASYVKFGPVTEVHASDNILLNSAFGVRLLSQTELINDVTITNTTGNICGIFGSFYPAYTVGTGNYGAIKVDGVSVADSWTCPSAAFARTFFNVGGSFYPLQISHVMASNPTQAYPLFTQYAASSGSTLLSEWSVTTTTSTYGSLINTPTSPGQLSVVGLAWNDSLGTGSVFAGTTVPSKLTCSNYAGPNLLLAGGYAPTIKNGDCFTNTYPIAAAASPTFSPVAGNYSVAQNVALASASAGAIICYNTTGAPSTNGTTGCTSGTLYASPIAVSAAQTLYAVAGGTGFGNSPASSAAYTIGVATVTYIDTIFNESVATVVLAGTTPTTCTNGCVGPWTLPSGIDFTYQTGGGVLTTNTNPLPDLINTGQTAEVIRYNLAQCSASPLSTCAFNVRYTDANNFVAINMSTAGWMEVYSVVSGTATQIGTRTATSSSIGAYTVTLSGSSISVVAPSGTVSGTTTNTGTKVGFQADNSGVTMKMSSLSVKSN